MRVRVVCGLSETIASLVPTSRFSSVDFPAFGRPMSDTKPDFIGGNPYHGAHRNERSSRGLERKIAAFPVARGGSFRVFRGNVLGHAHFVDASPLHVEHL